MRRSAWISLTWLAIVVVSPLHFTAAAEAQRGRRAPQDAERKAAREAYAQGVEFFKQGRFEEAETAFQEAYRHVANPLVLLGIAETRERRADIPGTIEVLEHYLRETDNPTEADRIRLRIGDLKSRPAKVMVESTPPGAQILLDGEETGFTTPKELEVPPGAHAISVSLEGYQANAETLEAGYGTRHDLTFELSPADEEPTPEDALGPAGGTADEPAMLGDEDPGKDHMTGVWVATGLAAVALVTGTVLGFLALSEQSEFDDNPTEDTADTGERLALFADVAFGVSAAAALTAIVLYATGNDAASAGRAGWRRGTELKTVSASPHLGPGGAGVTARVRF